MSDKRKASSGGWFAAFCWTIDRGARWVLKGLGLYRDAKEVVEVVVPAAVVVKNAVVATTKGVICKVCSTLKAVGISWSSLCALQSAYLTAFAVALTTAGGISLILVVGVMSTALRI